MAASAKKEVSAKVQGYLGTIAAYEKEFKKWENSVEKILKRYRDEKRESNESSRFPILWSNVQTLVPATFSRLPQPDVSRRFRDNDPVGRVASLILERALDFEVQHYADYRSTVTQVVHDRFLGGRGTCWARYEPHFKEQASQPAAQPSDGAQVTEDAGEAQMNEALDYECAPVDYVHWKDFGHDIARSWEEVTLVWRNVYMSEAAVTERFGSELSKKIPYDATPEDLKRANRGGGDASEVKKQARIIELWDKTEGCAYWLSKSMKEVLDEREDPLGLQEFFPCPRPLYATMTNETLIPVPDFKLYQDQANTLDILSSRIAELAGMLQVKGVYDSAADSAVGRLFKEGLNGDLLPVKNWAAFAEKNGLKGQVDVLDLTMIALALKGAMETMEQVKNQVYEITGISDIIRGATDPNETLGAQEMKGQYAGMRLRAMQNDVAQFATDALRLKAQIICAQFAPQTILAIAAVEQLSTEDQQMVPQAMELLIGQERAMNPEAESPNPLRSFRVDVAADTLVQIDEGKEKQERMEMLTAFGAYLEKAAQVGAQAPAMVPLLIEVGKFGLTAFKVGKAIEGTFDAALDQMKQAATQPQGIPPEVQEEMQKKGEELQAQEQDLQKRETTHQVDKIQFGADKQVFQAERNAHDKLKAGEEKMAQERMGIQSEREGMKIEKGKAELDQSAKDAQREGKEVEAKKTDSAEIEGRNKRMEQVAMAAVESSMHVTKSVEQMAKVVEQLTKVLASPKRHMRGPDGKITHSVAEPG